MRVHSPLSHQHLLATLSLASCNPGALLTTGCPPPCSAQIPYFNAPIFLENKTQIGKVEEILGPINNVVSTACTACSTL